jgi:hypothetical protein
MLKRIATSPIRQPKFERSKFDPNIFCTITFYNRTIICSNIVRLWSKLQEIVDFLIEEHPIFYKHCPSTKTCTIMELVQLVERVEYVKIVYY